MRRLDLEIVARVAGRQDLAVHRRLDLDAPLAENPRQAVGQPAGKVGLEGFLMQTLALFGGLRPIQHREMLPRIELDAL